MEAETLSNAETITADARLMLDQPGPFFGWSHTAMHSLARPYLESLQLAGLRRRFDELRDRIPVLKKLADQQKLQAIVTLDAAVPVLFPHTVYKSYPPSILENSKFGALTAWLQKLTATDLSRVDVSRCESIDSWLEAMDAGSGLWLIHTSGTSGTLSFLPRSKSENDKFSQISNLGIFQGWGDPGLPPESWPVMHLVQPGFRTGGSLILKSNDNFLKWVARSESRVHTQYSGRLSSDLVFLAARARAAAAKGDLDRLKISPQFMARRDEFERLQKESAAGVLSFLERVLKQIRGERVFMSGTWNVHYKIAKLGLEQGLENILAPGSVVQTGGGAKGEVVPPDWEALVKQFFGIPRLSTAYGMSEVMARNGMCERERYHIEPTAILFALDPDTGAPLPRQGVQTGRAAFFDLLADSYWGGFVTGDEITVDWSSRCACGRLSPHIARKIERYSEKRGGDDKISCAAQADAYEAAMDVLTNLPV
jgi:hypothetical protein